MIMAYSSWKPKKFNVLDSRCHTLITVVVSKSGSLGFTIMEKTADLPVVKKTVIDTLHTNHLLIEIHL